MNDNILGSVKSLLGIPQEDTYFDNDLVLHINSVFGILSQLSPLFPVGFKISGVNETWDDYLADEKRIEFARTYVYLKVRLLFDPPTGGVLEATQKIIDELEWRLSIAETT